MKTSESDPLQVDWISYETNDSTLVLVNNIGMCMVPGRNKKIHRRNIEYVAPNSFRLEFSM
jgi:hypothetical protein